MKTKERRVFKIGQSVWVNIEPTLEQKKRIAAGDRMIILSGYSGIVVGTDWPFINVQSSIDGKINYELRNNVTHY
jgi:hypothetical protein